eukprot:scaffold995_cov135-Skeletonema_menzelii.AAC.2
MNLILLKQSEIQSISSSSTSQTEQIIHLTSKDERAKHIANHLNKKSGETVSIGIIGGQKGKAIVQHQNGGGIRLEIQSDTLFVPPEEPGITVILAVPFPMRIKALWPVISSFTAVTRIVIVKGQLSNPEFNATKNLLPEVYSSLIEKGMMQGGRTRQVKVDVCVSDDDTVSKDLLNRLGLLCKSDDKKHDGVARVFLDCGDETTTPTPARDVVLEHCSKVTTTAPPSAIIAIGPERGWTAEEASLFVNECGYESATLGNSILRVDTAVIASLGIVSAALDECNRERIREEGTYSKRQRKTSQFTSPSQLFLMDLDGYQTIGTPPSRNLLQVQLAVKSNVFGIQR